MLTDLRAPINLVPVLDDISVVIPTIGRPILKESLYWVTQGSAWPAAVIVVDQGTNPQVATWIETLRTLGIKAEHVVSQQRGKAAAVNRGIERVQTRFVVVTDDDCFVASDWLEKIAHELYQAPHCVITGPAKALGDNETVAEVNLATAVTSYRPGLKHDLFCGSNMGVAISLIRRIGLFDEDHCLVAAEDCEWAYRTLRAGVPIAYKPEVIVEHYSWRNAEEREERYRLYASSLGGFYGKYLRRGDWRIALRVVINYLRALRRWARGSLRDDQEALLHGRAYAKKLLPGVLAGLRCGK
jgi:GT2 family glycosyltransferase